ncbi:MAG TPA: hypothetical protein DCO71_01515 [Gammaproteobacteria bacterium]|nr:hypothetical protein [Gammaproteobacteria bacterium]
MVPGKTGLEKRDSRWSQINSSDFDVVIIGGGISGASLFARMAADGYKTLLIDKGDFGSATSQASGMMIWGGLLYLKSLDFRTVFTLCRDRDNLISQCPSRIRSQYYYYFPLKGGWQFTPLVKGGLDFYRLIGGMRRGRNYIEKKPDEKDILKSERFRSPLAYEEGMLNHSDCRFIVDLIRQYDSDNAIPLNHVEFNKANYSGTDKRWHIELTDHFAHRTASVTSRLVINATGPFCDHVNRIVDIRTPYKHVFSKGVYLAFRRPDSHVHPLIFAMGYNSDVQTFVPWGPVSLWGPTETSIAALDEEIIPTAEDVSFLLEQANRNLLCWLGLVPIFCESEPGRLGIDPDDMERKITQRTRAVVVVHLWGMPAKMSEIDALSKKHNLLIIEDASHVHGATWRDIPCGRLGDISVFSLQGDKLAPSGEGGVLLCDDDTFYERAVCLGDITRIIELDSPARRFAATSFGIKTRISPLSAALGRSQLTKLESHNRQRNRNHEVLSSALEESGFDTFLPPPHIKRVYFEFIIRARFTDFPLPALIGALQAEGCRIDLPRYPLLHQQPFFTEGHWKQILRLAGEEELPDYSRYTLPNTESASLKMLKLPVFPGKDNRLLDEYITAFHKVLTNKEAILAAYEVTD